MRWPADVLKANGFGPSSKNLRSKGFAWHKSISMKFAAIFEVLSQEKSSRPETLDFTNSHQTRRKVRRDDPLNGYRIAFHDEDTVEQEEFVLQPKDEHLCLPLGYDDHMLTTGVPMKNWYDGKVTVTSNNAKFGLWCKKRLRWMVRGHFACMRRSARGYHGVAAE